MVLRSHCRSMAIFCKTLHDCPLFDLGGGGGGGWGSRNSRCRGVLSWSWRPTSGLVLLFDTQRLLVNVPDLFRGGCIEREYFLSEWRGNSLGIILLIISLDGFHPMKTKSHVVSNLRIALLFIYAPCLRRSAR